MFFWPTGTYPNSPFFKFTGHNHSKPWFYTPDYGHHALCHCFSLWRHKLLAVLRNVSSAFTTRLDYVWRKFVFFQTQTLSESKVFHDIPGMKSTCVAHAHPARHQATETVASDSRTPACTVTFCTWQGWMVMTCKGLHDDSVCQLFLWHIGHFQ